MTALLSLLACSVERAPKNQVAASFHLEEMPVDHKVDISRRKVFPFSIVPGGILNRQDVESKVDADQTVKSHYGGIQVDKLKPYRLTQPAHGYVSYRVGNRVFWTSKRLYLKPGEMLLSDGANLLRARCGNRLSSTPQAPVMPVGEPTQAALDLPSYDLPNFQGLPGDLPAFKLQGNAPQPLAAMTAKVPEEVFSVAPPVIKPGMIGGGLPGGLPSIGNDGGIILQSGYWFLVAYVPNILENPTFSLPPLSPVFLAVNVLSPVFGAVTPIGIGSSLFPVFQLPSLTGSVITIPGELPPVYNISTFQISNGTPPFIVSPPSSVVPPGGSNSNPDPNPGGPGGGGGGSNPPGTPPNPPSIEEPPAFQPIPEPSTFGMVGLAALMFVLVKRKL